jgi:hypothetical protein
VLVGWDTLDAPTWRHHALEGYQGGRRFDAELIDQLELLPEFVAACGFAWAKAAGYEADDFLAAAVADEEGRGGTVLVASGDRDAFQLASDKTTILQPVRAGEIARIGPAEVLERYGVAPGQVPDFIALRGDPSDKLPGARGVGPKGAAKLLRQHGTLEQALAAGELAAQADGRPRPQVRRNHHPALAGVQRRHGDPGSRRPELRRDRDSAGSSGARFRKVLLVEMTAASCSHIIAILGRQSIDSRSRPHHPTILSAPSGEEAEGPVERGDAAIDHVDDLELLRVQLHNGRGRAAIVDHQDVEALVGEAAHGRGDALIGEDPSDHHVLDAHVAQDQAQIGAGESAGSGLGSR